MTALDIIYSITGLALCVYMAYHGDHYWLMVFGPRPRLTTWRNWNIIQWARGIDLFPLIALPYLGVSVLLVICMLWSV